MSTSNVFLGFQIVQQIIFQCRYRCCKILDSGFNSIAVDSNMLMWLKRQACNLCLKYILLLI